MQRKKRKCVSNLLSVLCAAKTPCRESAIRRSLCVPNTGSHNVFTLELSLGRAAGHFESFEDAEALIQAADESMYTQKKEKKTLRA